MIWFIVGWLICGVLAYGLCKNWWFWKYQNDTYLRYVGWNKFDEMLCWFVGFCGIAGLVVEILMTCEDRYKFRLRYRMPKELCEPRHFEEEKNGGAAENLRELWEKGLPPNVEKGLNDLRHPE